MGARKRPERLSVYLTADEYAQLDARRGETSRSDYVRALLGFAPALRGHPWPAKDGAPAEGSLVAYQHPSWGPCTGRVLRVLGGRVLVQDQAPNGAREWWPLAEVRAV